MPIGKIRLAEVSLGCLLRTTFIELVDFHRVEVAEGCCLAQPDVIAVLAVLWDDGWLPVLRVCIPEHTDQTCHIITHGPWHDFSLRDLHTSVTYIPKCMIEL